MQETDFIKQKITKEQKQDLMHVAVCTVLSQGNYYDSIIVMKMAHFKQLKEMPSLNLIEQENFLKDHILLYFGKQGF